MSTQPALLPSTLIRAAPTFAIQSDWKTAACMLTVDVLALSLVLGLAVFGRHTVASAYALSAASELLPCLSIVLIAFWAQGLYPGVLLHPAEEMRRVVLSIGIVFLGISSTTFLWRNAESYSRSVFLLTWVACPPVVLLSRYILRRSLAEKSW